MSKRSLGLVGCGYWGKNLARNFDALGALHTLCDGHPETLEKQARLYPKAQCTADLQALIVNPEITQIAIATPAKEHYQMARQALVADKDVYVEKPLCLDLEEAQELVTLAQERGRILMVGHILHYHPCVQRLQKLVADGELGELLYISSHRLNLGKICFHESSLWSYAPHDISVILSLLGGTLPTQVRCSGGTYLSPDVADLTMTTLSFPGRLKAHIYVSWLNPFKEQKLTVVGSAGMAVFDDTQPWEEKLVLYRDYLHWSEQGLPTPSPHHGAEPVVAQVAEPLREECAHFLQCCQTRSAPRTDGREGLRVQTVLQATHESLFNEGKSFNPAQDLDRELHSLSAGELLPVG